MDCILPGSSVHGIFQARILEWVPISFSRDLPNPGNEPALPAWQLVSLLLNHLGMSSMSTMRVACTSRERTSTECKSGSVFYLEEEHLSLLCHILSSWRGKKTEITRFSLEDRALKKQIGDSAVRVGSREWGEETETLVKATVLQCHWKMNSKSEVCRILLIPYYHLQQGSSLITMGWEGLGAGEGDDRGWDGWMASLTWWMWVWVEHWELVMDREVWLAAMGSQGVGHDWTELNRLKELHDTDTFQEQSVERLKAKKRKQSQIHRGINWNFLYLKLK